ncbi:MAG: GNAT family N-acetyltransferase [Litoreibacter sp.]|nr:GNAT family N-acetyltransferase [Litoreibacter sp.]MCY4336853.1 GNAT family N-acetyltransferase [Litoreibacter sp.]
MLRTQRLLIRPARENDAEGLFEVYGDPETMRFWDTLPDTQLEQTQRRVHGFMRAENPTYFVLEHKGRAVGTAGIHAGDELGFILHRGLWRQGLMRECLDALIPWSFATLALSQITADVDPRNTGSITLLTRIGFLETGRAQNTIQVGDEWCDSVYFKLSS